MTKDQGGFGAIEAVEGDAPDGVPEATPELRLEVARRVAELSGKTVGQVLEEDLFGDRGDVVA